MVVSYLSTGTYTVRLRVRDDKGAYGYDTCTVYVVSIGITMAPGESSYVGVNNDDDNENGIMDMCEDGAVDGENDLRRVLLSVITPKPTDKVYLSLVPQGEPQMQVWGEADRQGLLISTKDGPTYVEWPSGNVPTEVNIEASSCSGPVDNKSLWLTYTGVDYNSIPPSEYPVDRNPPAKIDFTCVELDMDMDGVNDDYYGPSLEKTDETVPGGFVPLNGLVQITLQPVLPTALQIDESHPVIFDVPAGSSKILIWEMTGDPVILPKYYYSRADLPDYLWVEGVETSADVRDITLALEYTIDGKIFDDKIKATVFDVDLLINNTTAQTDDYVVLQKSGDERDIPKNWPVGAPDNHIPMKVHLEGPSGFSCKVKLTTNSGGGEIIIKKTDGSQYPAEGESVTVGTDLLVRIFGTLPSDELDDVIITAKTDKTNEQICAEEDLTVIWVYSFRILFRGSFMQGEALTACSTAKFTPFQPWRQDKVGKFIYHKPTGGNFDAARYQMEFNILPTPEKVISDVEWDIKREASIAYWGPGTDPRSRIVLKGETDWADDDSANDDEDLIQYPDCKKNICYRWSRSWG